MKEYILVKDYVKNKPVALVHIFVPQRQSCALASVPFSIAQWDIVLLEHTCPAA